MEGIKVTRYSQVYKAHVSCSVSSPKNICLYKHNEPTLRPPGGGPLAIFKTKEEAQNFINLQEGHKEGQKLYAKPCSYEPSAETSLWLACSTGLGKKSNFPKGTAFADSVTIRRK